MAWTDEQIQNVWNKGHPVSNNDSAIWRQDDCGAWIRRSDYGNRNSKYGWEVDHINPARGDNLSNLRPLQWKNNAAKQDNIGLDCPVTASGTDNVDSSED
jgi:hypothetical protein